MLDLLPWREQSGVTMLVMLVWTSARFVCVFVRRMVEYETMRRCAKCADTKEDDDFGWKNKRAGTKDAYCRPCRRQYNKGHYRAQKGLYFNRNTRTLLKMRAFLREQKEGKPCQDCGGVFPPCVMDFDHLDPKQKVKSVAELVQSGSQKALLREIEKCDLVCANCHRIRTCVRDHDHALKA